MALQTNWESTSPSEKTQLETPYFEEPWKSMSPSEKTQLVNRQASLATTYFEESDSLKHQAEKMHQKAVSYLREAKRVLNSIDSDLSS